MGKLLCMRAMQRSKNPITRALRVIAKSSRLMTVLSCSAVEFVVLSLNEQLLTGKTACARIDLIIAHSNRYPCKCGLSIKTIQFAAVICCIFVCRCAIRTPQTRDDQEQHQDKFGNIWIYSGFFSCVQPGLCRVRLATGR